jgi:hypothetical protein
MKKLLMVRVCGLNWVISGASDPVLEHERIPKFPTLSAAKMSGFVVVGWNERW